MHQCEAAQGGIVLDLYMARQCGIVGEHGMRAHTTVMGDMHIGHDPIVVANPGDSLILYSPAADTAILADDIAIANL